MALEDIQVLMVIIMALHMTHNTIDSILATLRVMEAFYKGLKVIQSYDLLND